MQTVTDEILFDTKKQTFMPGKIVDFLDKIAPSPERGPDAPSTDPYDGGMRNPAFKKLVVEALRSGKYKQCLGMPHYRGAFCAMGLIAHLRGVPPEEFYISPERIGMNSLEMGRITCINDGGASFGAIATYIEGKEF